MKKLEELFFKAEKITAEDRNPVKFRVKGNPYSESEIIDYKDFSRDFTFVSYKDVIAGGILRAMMLFNLKPCKVVEHEVMYGRRKQWFTAELVSSENDIIIEGEKHFPFLSVSYSYDVVNAVKYEIGIYRSKCSNGLIFGYKALEKTTVKPEDVFNLDFWYNPCLLYSLIQEYERSIAILKKTEVTPDTLRALVNGYINPLQGNRPLRPINAVEFFHFDSGRGIESMINSYSEELGSNLYAALNTVTELASNFTVNNILQNDVMDHTKLVRQRKAGIWLNQLISFIELSNDIKQITDFDHALFGQKPVKDRYVFDLRKFEDFIM